MTMYIYKEETAEVVEKVTGGTQTQQMDYADSNYDSADYGWTYRPEWGQANGLVDTGDAKKTHLAEKGLIADLNVTPRSCTLAGKWRKA